MKKVMNKAEDMVLEMAKGMVLAHPELELISKYKVIKKKQLNPQKVSLISGGGSGHEPAHAGYIGKEITVAEFADMMQAAVKGIQATGERSFGRGAIVGDKTLIDALVPCADAWTASAQAGDDLHTALTKGAEAAVQGAESTKNIVARMGRAGAVGERSISYPDAGAHALGVIFTELAQSLHS